MLPVYLGRYFKRSGINEWQCIGPDGLRQSGKRSSMSKRSPMYPQSDFALSETLAIRLS